MVNIPAITATVDEIKPNLRVNGTYLVRRKNRGVGKTGKAWLQLILGDRTGTIDARIWDNVDSIFDKIDENSVVDVEGQGVEFMDAIQLKVAKINPSEAGDPTDFLPESNQSGAQLGEALQQEFAQVDEPWIQKLLQAYVEDAVWWSQFLRAPAAKSVHHAYIGGLAEHTLSMMRLARTIGNHYKQMNMEPLNVDVLVAGAFLHDTGKVEELSVEAGFAYTDQGRLIGHIQLGIDLLDQRVESLAQFPADLHTHLRHAVLSHHGEYEFGSPRRPKTMEAIILHFIDNLDARVGIFQNAIHGSNGSGAWSGYEAIIGRHVYRNPIDLSDGS